MRITTDDENDPCFVSLVKYSMEVRVFLNGAEYGYVVTADEEKRYAKTLRLDNNGVPRRNPKDPDGGFLYDEFWGHVRIEAPDWLRVQMDELRREFKEVKD